MKKVILSAALAALLLTACKQNEAKPEPMPTPPVVEDPAPEPTPEPQTNTANTTTSTTTTTNTRMEEDPDGTSVLVGDGGINVSTKKGDKSNNVKLSTTTKEVQVKTTE